MRLFGGPKNRQDVEKLEEERDIKGLLKALESRKLEVCEQAFRALVALNEPTAIDPILAKWHRLGIDKEHESMLLEFAKANSTKAVESLIRVLSDSNYKSRGTMVDILGKLGDKRAVEPLIQELNRSDRNDILEVSWKAFRALVALNEPTAIDPILANWDKLGHKEDARGYYTPSYAPLHPIVHKKLIRDREDVSMLLEFAKANSTKSVESLIRALSDSNYKSRGTMIDILGKLGDKRAVEPLIQELNRSHWGEVSWKAFRALVALNEPTAIDPILANWDKLGHKEDASVLYYDSIDIIKDSKLGRDREDESMLLEFAKANSTESVESLIGFLNDSNRKSRGTMADILGKLGDKRAVEPLIQALDDNDWRVSSNAATALGVLGDERAVKPLIQALYHTNYETHWNAADALSKFHTPEVVSALIQILNSGKGKGPRREAVREALVKIGGDAALNAVAAYRTEIGLTCEICNRIQSNKSRLIEVWINDEQAHYSPRELYCLECAQKLEERYRGGVTSIHKQASKEGYQAYWTIWIKAL